ncbi:MAG: hypothetical protein HC929_18060 [Leptolyngbyaceae cyanobacterium SM2_5_2]|nr:hypothetical protein [Leptolyngbyaceae cyanobacterium SM2_5_2]
MNAPTDSANLLLLASASAAPTAFSQETAPAADDKICWIEVHQFPYAPDQQVELLHLQAEAEALLLHLQALQQKRKVSGSHVAEKD